MWRTSWRAEEVSACTDGLCLLQSQPVGVSAYQSASAHCCTARSIGHGTVHNTCKQKQFRSLPLAAWCPQIYANNDILKFRRVGKIPQSVIGFVVSLCRYVRPSAWNNSAPTGRIFMKFIVWVFFSKNSPRNSIFHYNLTWITGTSHADRSTFLIISR